MYLFIRRVNSSDREFRRKACRQSLGTGFNFHLWSCHRGIRLSRHFLSFTSFLFGLGTSSIQLESKHYQSFLNRLCIDTTLLVLIQTVLTTQSHLLKDIRQNSQFTVLFTASHHRDPWSCMPLENDRHKPHRTQNSNLVTKLRNGLA